MRKSGPQTQVVSGILRCPRAFRQVPRCWCGGLWCPAAPATRDLPALCLSRIPKGTSSGISPSQGSTWDQTLLQRRRLICSEEKQPQTEVRSGGPLHWPIDSPLHDQDSLCYRPPPCAQLGHTYPIPCTPSAILNQRSKSELRVQGICWPPAGLSKVFLWCTMTEPLVKEAQTWTRIPPHWARYSMDRKMPWTWLGVSSDFLLSLQGMW